MTLPFTRAAWRPLCSAAVLGAALWAAGASAAERRFDLPAQPLAASLSRLAQQAQVQVLFDESLLRGLRAPALSGSYGVREALERLLVGSELELVEAGGGYVVRQRQVDAYSDNALQLDAQTIVGNGREVDASNVGRSTLTRRDIERQQADNIPSLLQTLPGVTMGGSPKPGGQTTNIWGLGDAEDVPYTLDGAQKSGFERYQQGTVFIEPEMIKRIEVEKGPHSVFTGNGGFGGTVHMETKDAPDLLREGRDVGAMLKYGYHSNDQQKIYSGAVFGRSEDRRVDALLYLNGRDGRDMKLADIAHRLPDQPQAPAQQRPGREDRPVQAQPAPHRGARPGLHLPALEKLALDAVLRQQLPDPAEPVDHRPLRLRAGPDPPAGPPRYHRHHLDRQVQLPSAGQPLDRPATELFRRPHRATRPSRGHRLLPARHRRQADAYRVPGQGPGTAQHQPFRYRSATARADPGRGAAQAQARHPHAHAGQDL